MNPKTFLFSMFLAVTPSLAFAQMGGPGGGDNAPAFFEPKFKDKLYESGGPRARQPKDGAIILSVTIEGNRTVSTNRIMSAIQSREDRVYDVDTLNRDIAELHRTNLFRKIEPQLAEVEHGVHIKLIVTENPIVNNVFFTGNQRIEDSQLRKQVGITKGDALDRISINSAKSRLREYYQDQGMSQATIDVASGLQTGQLDVEFVIKEGPVERIKSITFEGNKDFSSEELRVKISSRDSRWFVGRYLFNRNLASDFKIEGDVQALIAHYRKLGYFDARVNCRKDYDTSGAWVDLTFIIFEGYRYKVKSVSITGTKRYEPHELLPYMKSKEGEYFHMGNKAGDERFIYDLYGRQGHYFCEVTGELVYQPGNEVDIIYTVNEGDIYRISDVRVHLEGEHTKERVLLHPLASIRPGSIINSKEMEGAERRLQHTTIFNNDPSQGIVPKLKVEPPEHALRD